MSESWFRNALAKSLFDSSASPSRNSSRRTGMASNNSQSCGLWILCKSSVIRRGLQIFGDRIPVQLDLDTFGVRIDLQYLALEIPGLYAEGGLFAPELCKNAVQGIAYSTAQQLKPCGKEDTNPHPERRSQHHSARNL